MKNSFPRGLNRIVFVVTLSLIFVGCDKGGSNYSLDPTSQSFQQNSAYTPKPIDVLWVVDNSASMETSQANMASNFASFIDRFQNLNYDFHMGVTSTEAYLGLFDPTNADSWFSLKDGGSTHSGIFVMTPATSNLSAVFTTNANLGDVGSGDERAFSSFESTLTYAGNSAFRRANASLAIIILSDEDDFSNTVGEYDWPYDHDYASPTLIPVSHYVDFLNTYAGQGNWSVSSIQTMDQNCIDELQGGSRIIGQRYEQLSAASTNGVVTSICGNFADSLNLISNSIVSLSSTFTLTREPDPSTIVVQVNGNNVIEDVNNGWSYNQSNLTIAFNGTAVPAAGANISINFTPLHPAN